MIVTLLSASLLLPPIRLTDRWFGEDKLKHFAASFVVSSLAASGARAWGADRDTRVGIAIGVGATAGVGKEVADRRAGGPFSFRDLVWDAGGITAAALVAHRTR
jgi:putative lipoprotein